VEVPYEVEVKLPLRDTEPMKKTILQAGGVQLKSEFQEDIYYDHPCRSFSETDESVRIRHITPAEKSESGPALVELTYKGPKIDKKTKTRIEYTVDLNEKDMESMIQILLNSGFKHVARITKHREYFDIQGITASMDDVTDVGRFIEFELIADGKDEMKKARNRVLELVKTLGLDENDIVRESYLYLYFENTS